MCRGLSKSLERFCLRRCRPIVIIWVQDPTGILKKGTLKTECDMKGMTDFMKTLVQTDLLQEVANIHGVDKETVRCSIREAIAAARHTENDTAADTHQQPKTVYDVPDRCNNCQRSYY